MSTPKEPRPPGHGTRIPGWVKTAVVTLMITRGIGAKVAVRRSVTVPEGEPVSDGNGGTRPAKKGEKRKLSEFVSWRHAHRWSEEPEVAQARLQIAEDHKALIRHETRKITREIVREMPMMARGVRPRRDEYGEVIRKDGKILCEDVGAPVQVQAWQVVLKLSQQVEDAPATKVEMSTPGGIQVEATYSAEVEALRARIS
jgi:hypothetical protein